MMSSHMTLYQIVISYGIGLVSEAKAKGGNDLGRKNVVLCHLE